MLILIDVQLVSRNRHGHKHFQLFHFARHSNAFGSWAVAADGKQPRILLAVSKVLTFAHDCLHFFYSIQMCRNHFLIIHLMIIHAAALPLDHVLDFD